MNEIFIAIYMFVINAYILALLFVVVMALKQRWNQLPLDIKILSIPAVVIALVVDVSFNILATIPFVDAPREWTFTSRMKRYKELDGNEWRNIIAHGICRRLNLFDSEHC